MVNDILKGYIDLGLQLENSVSKKESRTKEYNALEKLLQFYRGNELKPLWESFKSVEDMSNFFLDSCKLLNVEYKSVILMRKSLISLGEYYNNLKLYQLNG